MFFAAFLGMARASFAAIRIPILPLAWSLAAVMACRLTCEKSSHIAHSLAFPWLRIAITVGVFLWTIGLGFTVDEFADTALLGY